tara:strand:+ start:27668 stop:28357 length:690 start_codon:yes stop_codon:yes gene_type:complete
MLKKKIILLWLISLKLLISQEQKPLNNPIYDKQAYHFGFTLGLSNTKFQIVHSELFSTQNNFDQILSQHEPGFNVGIIMDLKINKNINLRVTPSFNFSDQKIDFKKNNITNSQPKSNSEVSNFELPLYLKYRSDRINNGRAYLLFGGNFMLNMSSVEKLQVVDNLKFKTTNYSIDVGFGIDLYFTYFKFSPEIKYCYGLRNMLVSKENSFSQSINKLYTRGLLISLTFE